MLDLDRPFDLEGALSDWRAAHVNLPAPAVEELVEHLRSCTEELAATGLTTEEAFLVATRRIGTPSQLDAEFDKVPGAFANRRVRWLLAGAIAAVVVPGAVRAVARAGALAGVSLGVPELALPWIVVAVGALFGVWLWWRAVGLPAGVRERVVAFVEGESAARGSRLRTAALVVGVALAVSAGKMFLNIGLSQVAPASAFGFAAIGQNILGMLISLTLIVGGAILLARRPPATS